MKCTKVCLNLIILMVLFFNNCAFRAKDNAVQIIYYGYSCFEFQYAGKRILIDPFSHGIFNFGWPKGKIDYGFVSHNAKEFFSYDGLRVGKIYIASGDTDEFDFLYKNKNSKLKGRIIENIGDLQYAFWTVPSFHDDVQGARNGVNGIICFDFDGVKVVHLGGIGHRLEEKQINCIGKVDILMVPVDDNNIVELETARAIVDQLSPVIVLPMSYEEGKSGNEAYSDDLGKFSRMFNNVKKRRDRKLTVHREDLKTELHLLLLGNRSHHN